MPAHSPERYSAIAARFASLPTWTGVAPSRSAARSGSAIATSRQRRFGASATTPAPTSTSPGTATVSPATPAPGGRGARPGAGGSPAEVGQCGDARVRTHARVERPPLAENLAAGEIDDEHRQVVDVHLGADRDHAARPAPGGCWAARRGRHRRARSPAPPRASISSATSRDTVARVSPARAAMPARESGPTVDRWRSTSSRLLRRMSLCPARGGITDSLDTGDVDICFASNQNISAEPGQSNGHAAGQERRQRADA